MFQGNLFNCSSSDDQIALLHSRFNTINGRANGTCNNNKIHGYSLSVDTSSNCYISQLNITVSQDMIGKTIQCVYDDGTTTKEVGNFSIEETQCYTRTVMTVSPTTGKLLIHVGLLANVYSKLLILYSNFTVYTNSSTHYLRKQHWYFSIYQYTLQRYTRMVYHLLPHEYTILCCLYLHLGIKSLSTGEATAITLCCSAFIVGIMITIIILLTFRFKKQLQAIQTSNSVHTIQDNPTSTSNATNLRQQTQATFHHAQNDEVSLV